MVNHSECQPMYDKFRLT